MSTDLIIDAEALIPVPLVFRLRGQVLRINGIEVGVNHTTEVGCLLLSQMCRGRPTLSRRLYEAAFRARTDQFGFGYVEIRQDGQLLVPSPPPKLDFLVPEIDQDEPFRDSRFLVEIWAEESVPLSAGRQLPERVTPRPALAQIQRFTPIDRVYEYWGQVIEVQGFMIAVAHSNTLGCWLLEWAARQHQSLASLLIEAGQKSRTNGLGIGYIELFRSGKIVIPVPVGSDIKLECSGERAAADRRIIQECYSDRLVGDDRTPAD